MRRLRHVTESSEATYDRRGDGVNTRATRRGPAMQDTISELQPRAWASVGAAIAVAALVGTVAELGRRRVCEIAVLDPRGPFDPYYGLAEYALIVVIAI